MAEQNAAGWSTPYKFTGKELDDITGLYYFGARYYDPRISLWMSVDPLAEKYPGWSPYDYTLNNPVRLIDPNGKEPTDEWEITLNSNGFRTVKWISDKGGDKTDLIRFTNGIPIPQKGAIDYIYSVDVEHYGKASNNEIPIGEIDKGPGYRVHDIGSNGALEDIDISDFIPEKGAIKGGVKITIAFLIKRIGKESIDDIKDYNRLVNELSKYGSEINKKELKEFEKLTEKFGGKLRYDLEPKKGKIRKPHVQIEDLGQSIEARKIWLGKDALK